jgi:hypothetical protein
VCGRQIRKLSGMVAQALYCALQDEGRKFHVRAKAPTQQPGWLDQGQQTNRLALGPQPSTPTIGGPTASVCVTPNRWPWTAEDYQTLRWLGHLDPLATADKIYRARSLSKGINAPQGLFPEVVALLPGRLPKELPWRCPYESAMI